MVRITINENDGGQRLDRFLRKYLSGAPLSAIHKMIRKDIRVNGRRSTGESRLEAGDELVFYISDERFTEFTGEPVPDSRSAGTSLPETGTAGNRPANPGIAGRKKAARRSFRIIYEDEEILAVSKPTGLLIHGDGREKKNTLLNQVTDYLIGKGEYIPRVEKSFSPAAANRLDRNTSGLVLFGKKAASLRALAAMFRRKDGISKRYLTVVSGVLTTELHLTGILEKDERENRVSVGNVRLHTSANVDADADADADANVSVSGTASAGEQTGNADANTNVSGEQSAGKRIETIVRPLAGNETMTLAEVELITGRTHQIRAHLAAAGFPVAGDPKYGSPPVNREMAAKYGLQHQFLHAYKIEIREAEEPLDGLEGKIFIAGLPQKFRIMAEAEFGTAWKSRCGL